jgi:hypothetical protein
MAAAGAVYAAAAMIYNADHHDGVLSVPVILAAFTAVGALLTRQVVTPVADPVDGAGRTLVPRPEPALQAPQLAGIQLGMLNALRSEAGLPPFPQEAHTIPPDADIHVVPPQPVRASQVIIENTSEPPAPESA